MGETAVVLDPTAVSTKESISLETYTDWVGSLAQEDARFIEERLRSVVDIRRTAMDELFLLNPGKHACAIPLPSGRVLKSSPRIRATNLFLMLARAYRMPDPFRDEDIKFDDLEEILEFVADYFAGLVDIRIAEGLFRSYLEFEDNLPFVRGRVVFAEDIRQNLILRHRTFCRFSELTWDIPENQVIRQVLFLLSGFAFRQAIRARLEQLDGQMDEVQRGRFKPTDLEGFTYHRLNAEYAPLHRLCRLFLESLSLSEELGVEGFRAFHLDMNKLFEKYVTQLLEERLPQGWRLSDQQRVFLAEDGRVPMRPDVVLEDSDRLMAVLDCKFKRTAPREFKNHDYYQLLSYCTALGVGRGGLIYPRSELQVEDEVSVQYSPVRIRRFTIDLDVEPSHVSAEADSLAERVNSWVA